jgi:hypothetical protein
MRIKSAMHGNACPISGSPDEQIAAQHAVIARFESALWDDGFDESLLPSYQSAWRRLEALIAEGAVSFPFCNNWNFLSPTSFNAAWKGLRPTIRTGLREST